MTDPLKRRESARAGWRRAGAEALEAMRHDLAHGHGAEGIHDARKRCKWLRALLRLARAGLAPDARRRENRRLRDLARSLGGARDAEVRLLTFKDLVARSRHRTAPAFKEWQARLEAGKAAAERAMDSAGVLARAQIMRNRAISQWAALPLRHHGWRLLAPGLRASFAHARGTFHQAAMAVTDEALHEWRRHVKTLGYQIGFLRQLRPRKIEAIATGLDELGDVLGRDHDLAVLWNDATGRRAESSLLEGMIARRRARLLAQAFALGKKLFSEKPRQFTGRFERWWRQWR